MILYHYKEMVSWILSITATGSVGESTIATEKSQIRVDVYTVSSWKRGYFTCQKKGPLWNIAAEFWMLEFKHLGSRGVTMGAEVKIVKPRSCNHPCLDEFHRDVHMSHWNHSFSAKSSQDCIASVSWRLVKYSNNQVSEIKRTLSCRHWLPSRSCEVADLKQTTFSPELEQTGKHFKAKLDSNTSPGLDMNIQTYDIFEQFSSLFGGFARGDFFWRKQLWFHYQVHLESKHLQFWTFWGRERQEGVDKVDEATCFFFFFFCRPFTVWFTGDSAWFFSWVAPFPAGRLSTTCCSDWRTSRAWMKKSQDWRALGVDGASPGTPQKLNIKPFLRPWKWAENGRNPNLERMKLPISNFQGRTVLLVSGRVIFCGWSAHFEYGWDLRLWRKGFVRTDPWKRFLVFVFLERGARNILRKRRLKHTPEGHILIGQFLEVVQLFFILLCRTKSMGWGGGETVAPRAEEAPIERQKRGQWVNDRVNGRLVLVVLPLVQFRSCKKWWPLIQRLMWQFSVQA